jgi:hypothetical protein
MLDIAVLQNAVRDMPQHEQADMKALLYSISLHEDRLNIVERKLMVASIDILPRVAAFGSQDARIEAHQLAWEIARELGIFPASIDALYRKFGREEIVALTVPAMNMRAIAFVSARGVFRAMRELKVGAAIFELSRGEIGFSGQRPHEYATAVLCAAIAEGHSGPVFIQGDHFQISASKFAEDPEAEIAAVEALIAEAVSAGFFNIDVDTSTLVDLSHSDVDAQQKPNYALSARLANFTRAIEPEGVTISLGGEIREVGEENSTVEEVNAYLTGFKAGTPEGQAGLTKLSIQSGTRHGGNVLADGSFGDMPIEFGLIDRLSAACRNPHGLGGCVQHGASMLTLEKIAKLPDAGCIEVHLAAAFLNAVYNNLSDDLVRQADDWAKENFPEDWKPGWSEAQFLHHARRFPIRPFKQAWWQATECHDAVQNAVYQAAIGYFRALRVENTKSLVEDLALHVPTVWMPPVLSMDGAAPDESKLHDLAS